MFLSGKLLSQLRPDEDREKGDKDDLEGEKTGKEEDYNGAKHSHNLPPDHFKDGVRNGKGIKQR